MDLVDARRVRFLREEPAAGGPVIYWMSRDQRVRDNWALIFAQQLARERKEQLLVLFCLVAEYLGATIRQYDFMLRGLAGVEHDLQMKKIPFMLVSGRPADVVPRLLRKYRAGALVVDFSPLRVNRQWQQEVIRRIDIPAYQVDAHNIVPVWITSDKQEYSARTIRPKIMKLLPEFLTPFPQLRTQQPFSATIGQVDWRKTQAGLSVKKSVPGIERRVSGEYAARRLLRAFIAGWLDRYATQRNDPVMDGQSQLSPYLHFGQLAAQRVALEVEKATADMASRAAFLEELIVRRELADNFCYYNPNYDSVDGFPAWGRQTLRSHGHDPRPVVYTRRQLEEARTGDELWNAAQNEMVYTGKMHGYLRMYWAKKILEWSRTPEEALKTAVYLNDTYELDGRDPNGYAGISWSIGGVHDRAWPERPVFGKIRYMSHEGCRRKFDVAAYMARINTIVERGRS